MPRSRVLHRASKLIRLLRRKSYRSALRHGTAGEPEHEPVLRLVAPRTVVDIGANVGQFAVTAIATCPGVKVISFEPLADAAGRFRSAMAASHEAVTLHEVAIAPTASRALLHRSRRNDSSSLLPLAGRQAEVFPGTEEIGTEEVRTARLDDCVAANALEHPCLLKIDVQGFELPALEGCESLLASFQHIYVELSFVELYIGQALAPEVIRWLASRGFDLVGVYNVSTDGQHRSVQADFLFESTAGR